MNTSRIPNSSGISEQRGAANIRLDIPSFRSAGHSLERSTEILYLSLMMMNNFLNNEETWNVVHNTFALQ